MKYFSIGEEKKSRRQFNVLGFKGFTAKRKIKSRGYKVEHTNQFIAIHLGRRSIYVKKTVKDVGKGFGV